MISAASSGAAERTSPNSLASPPPSVSSTAPKAPKSTLRNERFIARHMMIERIRPEAPSSAPATISSLLLSTRPSAAAERPA